MSEKNETKIEVGFSGISESQTIIENELSNPIVTGFLVIDMTYGSEYAFRSGIGTNDGTYFFKSIAYARGFMLGFQFGSKDQMSFRIVPAILQMKLGCIAVNFDGTYDLTGYVPIGFDD
jgi:hypothetical protein